MDIQLPNGRMIQGVPEGVSKDEIKAKAISSGQFSEEDFTSIPKLPVELQEPIIPEMPSVPSNPQPEPSLVDRAENKVLGFMDNLETAAGVLYSPVLAAGEIIGEGLDIVGEEVAKRPGEIAGSIAAPVAALTRFSPQGRLAQAGVGFAAGVAGQIAGSQLVDTWVKDRDEAFSTVVGRAVVENFTAEALGQALRLVGKPITSAVVNKLPEPTKKALEYLKGLSPDETSLLKEAQKGVGAKPEYKRLANDTRTKLEALASSEGITSFKRRVSELADSGLQEIDGFQNWFNTLGSREATHEIIPATDLISAESRPMNIKEIMDGVPALKEKGLNKLPSTVALKEIDKSLPMSERNMAKWYKILRAVDDGVLNKRYAETYSTFQKAMDNVTNKEITTEGALSDITELAVSKAHALKAEINSAKNGVEKHQGTKFDVQAMLEEIDDTLKRDIDVSEPVRKGFTSPLKDLIKTKKKKVKTSTFNPKTNLIESGTKEVEEVVSSDAPLVAIAQKLKEIKNNMLSNPSSQLAKSEDQLYMANVAPIIKKHLDMQSIDSPELAMAANAYSHYMSTLSTNTPILNTSIMKTLKKLNPKAFKDLDGIGNLTKDELSEFVEEGVEGVGNVTSANVINKLLRDENSIKELKDMFVSISPEGGEAFQRGMRRFIQNKIFPKHGELDATALKNLLIKNGTQNDAAVRELTGEKYLNHMKSLNLLDEAIKSTDKSVEDLLNFRVRSSFTPGGGVGSAFNIDLASLAATGLQVPIIGKYLQRGMVNKIYSPKNHFLLETGMGTGLNSPEAYSVLTTMLRSLGATEVPSEEEFEQSKAALGVPQQ